MHFRAVWHGAAAMRCGLSHTYWARRIKVLDSSITWHSGEMHNDKRGSSSSSYVMLEMRHCTSDGHASEAWGPGIAVLLTLVLLQNQFRHPSFGLISLNREPQPL